MKKGEKNEEAKNFDLFEFAVGGDCACLGS
jgi:hypothetical protein